MSVVLAVLTDGRRECIERTIPSLEEMVTTPIARRLIIDDSGDPAYSAWLDERFPTFDIYGAPQPRRGYARAIRRLRDTVVGNGEDWAFVVEDDFVFHRPVDLFVLGDVMRAHPHVAQMVLPRQPWYPRERRAGGILEVWPDRWTLHSEPGYGEEAPDLWREHRLFWSMNPHLVRTAFLEANPWPLVDRSEREMGRRVLRDPATTVGLWGGPGETFVEHIGRKRVGTGY